RDFHVTGVQTCALPIWLLGIVRRALDERINFNERARVKKLFQALPGRLLARRPLLLHPPLAAAGPAASPPLLELLQLFRHGLVEQCVNPPKLSARPRRPDPARARPRRRRPAASHTVR